MPLPFRAALFPDFDQRDTGRHEEAPPTARTRTHARTHTLTHAHTRAHTRTHALSHRRRRALPPQVLLGKGTGQPAGRPPTAELWPAQVALGVSVSGSEEGEMWTQMIPLDSLLPSTQLPHQHDLPRLLDSKGSGVLAPRGRGCAHTQPGSGN